jgi:hypothetical protein
MDGRKLVVFALLWMGMLVLLAYPSYRFHKEQPEMMLDQVDGLFQVVDSRASHFKIVNGSGRSDQNFTVQDTQGKIWKWQVDPAKAPLVCPSASLIHCAHFSEGLNKTQTRHRFERRLHQSHDRLQ